MRVAERRELERRGEATRAGGEEVQTADAKTFMKPSPTLASQSSTHHMTFHHFKILGGASSSVATVVTDAFQKN